MDKEKKLLPVTTSPVTTSEAVPSTSAVNQSEMGAGTSKVNQSGDKKVRLQTSDGRQVMLTLVKEITYTELQKLIYQTVEVPANRQKIRVGFPPKLLNAPVEGEEEGIIQLQHGDKIALEVLPDTSLPIQEKNRSLKMADYKQLFKTTENQNWLKAVVAIHITKTGLSDFVTDVAVKLRDKITNDIQQGVNLPAGTRCSKCNTCPEAKCGKFRQMIKTYHRFQGPSWKNSNPNDWCTHPWEVAKCFFPGDGYRDKCNAQETDFNGIVGFILNSTTFDGQTGENLSDIKGNKFYKCRQFVNIVRHSSTLQVKDADLKDYITQLKDLLTSGAVLQTDKEACNAHRQLILLENDKLTITTDEIVKVIEDTLVETKQLIIKAYEVNEEASNINANTRDLQTKLETLNDLYTRAVEGIEKQKQDAIKALKKEKEKKVVADARDEMAEEACGVIRDFKAEAMKTQRNKSEDEIYKEKKNGNPNYANVSITKPNKELSTDNMELKTEKGTSDMQLLAQRHPTDKIHKLILDGFEQFRDENLSHRRLECKMRQHIKTRLEQKAIVYAAYRENQTEQIVFVVLTTKNVNKTEFKSNCGRYYIFLRNVQDCSDENGKTVDKEIDDDIGYSESDLRSINECVRKVSRDLMGTYLNVTMVTPGPCKSKNYGRGDHMIEQKVCIVISVLVKGLIPIGTRPFESMYFERPIDVREDVFDHMVLHHPKEKVHPVRIGCQLESAIYNNEDGKACVAEGSIGCLLRNEGNDLYALSCAHIFLSENELVKQKNEDKDICQLNEERRRVYQATNEKDEHFGRLEKVLYKEGNDTDDSSVGMDIALIKVDESRQQTERYFPDAGRLDQLGFTEIEEMQFLPTNRGNQLVHKYGCKTLLTRGIFRGETGSKTDESGTIFFNQYIVHSKEEMTFAEEGDSGALVFRAMNVPDKETGRLEVLGILLGKGTNINKKIYVTPIENILTAIGDANMNHFKFYTDV